MKLKLLSICAIICLGASFVFLYIQCPKEDEKAVYAKLNSHSEIASLMGERARSILPSSFSVGKSKLYRRKSLNKSFEVEIQRYVNEKHNADVLFVELILADNNPLVKIQRESIIKIYSANTDVIKESIKSQIIEVLSHCFPNDNFEVVLIQI